MKEMVTNKQIALIVFGATVGYGVISLPKDVAEKAGTGGWIVVLIGTLILIVSAYMYVYLGNSFQNKTIFEYMPILTGKLISYFIIMVFIIYEIISFSLVTRLSSETIRLTILLNTPVWTLSLFLLLVVFYTLTKSFRTLARISEIFGMIVVISSIAIFIAILTQGDLTNIRPAFAFEEIDYFSTLSVIAFALVGIDILAVIPMGTKNKKLFKYIFFMVLLIGFMYILILESCLSVMGVDSTIHYEEALFATIRRIEIGELQFLKRLDGIFIIVWLVAIYCSVLLEAYVAVYLIFKLVKEKSRNIILLVVLFCSIGICLLPANLKTIRMILYNVGYVGIFINVIVPLLLYILAIIRKYRNNNISH